MEIRQVPGALAQRLGHEATAGLRDLLEDEHIDWSEHMLNIAAERFERRLTQEVSGLRVDLVRELHAARVETVRLSFLFWIGQVAAIATVLSFMLRSHA